MKRAYIVNGFRSAIANFGGSLSAIRCDDLCAAIIRAVMDRNPTIDKFQIGEVIIGCANQAGEDNRNIARMSSLLAGLPVSVPGITVNRLCASGLSAVADASRQIQCSDSELVIAGGVEHMTRGPLVMNKASQAYGRDQHLYDSSFGWRFVNPKMEELYGVDAMGETAEKICDLMNITREDQDGFAEWSQRKAVAAATAGRHAAEITPVSISSGGKKQKDVMFTNVFNKDEFIKPHTSMESLAKLRPAFRTRDGRVTAGNSSGLNDGAAAMLLASEQALCDFNLTPMARVVTSAAVGVQPQLMGLGPVPAANAALAKANLTWNDMDVIELNEAFAAQCLGCLRQWGIDDCDSRVNPNGGAIALGHPLGMSGARVALSAAMELSLTGKKYAMVTMCVGVGQGYAVILERV